MKNPFNSLVTTYIKNSDLMKSIKPDEKVSNISSLEGYVLSTFINVVANKSESRVFVILPNSESINLFKDDFDSNDVPVLILKQNSKILYSRASNDFLINQIKVLRELESRKNAIVVTDLRTAITPMVNIKKGCDSLKLRVGDTFNLEEIRTKLSENDYTNTSVCDTQGTMSFRGEVVDIFPYDEDNAIRIYLDFDEIKSISHYNIITQETIEKVNSVTLDFATSITSFTTLLDYINSDDTLVLSEMARLNSNVTSVEKEDRKSVV